MFRANALHVLRRELRSRRISLSRRASLTVANQTASVNWTHTPFKPDDSGMSPLITASPPPPANRRQYPDAEPPGVRSARLTELTLSTCIRRRTFHTKFLSFDCDRVFPTYTARPYPSNSSGPIYVFSNNTTKIREHSHDHRSVPVRARGTEHDSRPDQYSRRVPVATEQSRMAASFSPPTRLPVGNRLAIGQRRRAGIVFDRMRTLASGFSTRPYRGPNV
jgi:hypothetical protein